MARHWLMHAVEKQIIKVAHRRFDWFFRPAAQVYRELPRSALELSIVEKSQAWAEISQNCRGPVDHRREYSCRSWLIMVLEKPRRLPLEFQIGAKMLPHRPCMTCPKAIVEPLVVGIVEVLLLQSPF